MFKLISKILLTLLIIKVNGSTTTVSSNEAIEPNITKNILNPMSLCGDWTQLGLKCYKVIETLSGKNDAKAQCQKLDSSSYLVQIKSSDDQKNVFDMLKSYNSKRLPVYGKGFKLSANNLWLGVSYGCSAVCEETEYYDINLNRMKKRTIDNEYRWEKSKLEVSSGYTNWDEDSPDTGAKNLCVQMNLETGKWSDVKCARKNLVVCEKDKKLTLETLYSAVDNAYKNLFEQFNEMKTNQEQLQDNLVNQVQSEQPRVNIDNVIPIGFIYTQLPNQSSPLDIWPNTQWTDITDQYSGLFFRAEGKGSQPFGQIQQQNYSRISHVIAHGIELNELEVPRYDKKFGQYEFDVKQGDWTWVNATNKQLHGVSFYQTDSDNIPINTAIRIWKRTG